jgi:hypothetical protein
MKEILEDFIDWARENLDDSMDMFEETECTIVRYFTYLKEQDYDKED